MTDTRPTREFTDIWRTAREFPGWLTEEQARLLWDTAVRLPAGAHIVEIGSHQARSTAILAAAVAVTHGRVTAIDPFDDALPPGHEISKRGFEANLDASGVRDVVDLRTDYSTRLRATWTAAIDLLYIDGEHGFHTVKDDLLWAAHVKAGSSILIHDAFSSIGVTRALMTQVLPRRRLRYVGRTGSLARFEMAPARARDTARLVAQLGWFARNVLVKVLITVRLGAVARVLGHRQGATFPY